jgi:hypothetical protein
MIVRRAASFVMLSLALLGRPASACDPPGPADPQLRLRLVADSLVGYSDRPQGRVVLTNVGATTVEFSSKLACKGDVRVDERDLVAGPLEELCILGGGSNTRNIMQETNVVLLPGESLARDARLGSFVPASIPAYYTAVAHWALHFPDGRCIDETSNVLGFRVTPATTDHPSY